MIDDAQDKPSSAVAKSLFDLERYMRPCPVLCRAEARARPCRYIVVRRLTSPAFLPQLTRAEIGGTRSSRLERRTDPQFVSYR
jgi:hypothetical protein